MRNIPINPRCLFCGLLICSVLYESLANLSLVVYAASHFQPAQENSTQSSPLSRSQQQPLRFFSGATPSKATGYLLANPHLNQTFHFWPPLIASHRPRNTSLSSLLFLSANRGPAANQQQNTINPQQIGIPRLASMPHINCPSCLRDSQTPQKKNSSIQQDGIR